MGENVRNRGRTFLTVLVLLIFVWPGANTVLADAGQESAAGLQYEVMKEAIQDALQLRFEQAHATLRQAEQEGKETLDAGLTRGIIAYLQTQWQTRQRPPAHVAGRKILTEIMQQGERQLADKPHQGRLQLLTGLAAVFGALLPQQETPWAPLQLAAEGQTRLQQALMSGEDMNDAHLGLGMLYFVGEGLPALGEATVGGRCSGEYRGGHPSSASGFRERAVRSGIWHAPSCCSCTSRSSATAMRSPSGNP